MNGILEILDARRLARAKAGGRLYSETELGPITFEAVCSATRGYCVRDGRKIAYAGELYECVPWGEEILCYETEKKLAEFELANA